MRALLAAASVLVIYSVVPAATSETVDVKYRGVVDLKPFACTDTPRSSFIQRVCFDKAESYDAFVTAPSMGQFYNQKIKGTGSDGPFDCRTHRVPKY